MRSPERSDETSAMSFWDHLDVLRGVLLRAAALLMVLAVLLFLMMPEIFDRFILAPCRPDFPVYGWIDRIASADLLRLGGGEGMDRVSIELVNINLTSQFMLHLSVSFWLAFLLAIPALLFLLWRFIAPGLYEAERRPISVALISGSLMFFCGVAFSYLVVFPITLRFLAGYQLSSLVPNVISIDSYMDTLIGISMAMGLVFEIPMVTWVLGRLHILTRESVMRYRRHAVVALLVLAAVITPTGDPFTLCVVFVPLYLLWEVSILVLPKMVLDRASDEM